MKRFHEIEGAESDEDELFGLPSQRGELIAKLNSEGKHPIMVGRAVFVIEQCEETDTIPVEVKTINPIRISVYDDPDVYGQSDPVYLYIEGNRSGLGQIFLQILRSDKKERIFSYEGVKIRDEFD